MTDVTERKMPRVSSKVLVVVMALGSAIAVAGEPTTVSEPVPQWAQEGLAKWYAAYNARDAKALVAFYAKDVVLRPAGQPPIRGRDAIESHYAQGFKAAAYSCTGGFDGFKIVAGTAVGWGHDACTEIPRAGGAGQTYESRWIMLYERQPDGAWLVVRDSDEDVGP
jgi:ketosteroid isomerase-like protein